MDNRAFELHELAGFKVWTRPGELGDQDMTVAHDLLVNDCYALREIRHMIGAPETIMDIGGHIGCFGMAAHRVWPNARIIAYEPHPVSAELYRRNARDNQIDVVVVEAAIAYDSTRTCLAEDAHTTGGAVLVRPSGLDDWQACGEWPHEIKEYRGICSCTMEDALSTHGIDYVGLLKMDCETSELEILTQMTDETAARVRFLVGEFHGLRNPWAWWVIRSMTYGG